MTSSYDYARGDLLEQRNSYMYTPDRGPAFLVAWRESRAQALAELPAPAQRPPPAEGDSGTDALLEDLLGALERGGTLPALEAMLQRFEVTKRIHARYTEHWRPEDPGDYRDLRRYVRFAEVLDCAYERLGDLRHLNALIKCVDTLVALRAGLAPEFAARLARLVEAEAAHVARLEQAS